MISSIPSSNHKLINLWWSKKMFVCILNNLDYSFNFLSLYIDGMLVAGKWQGDDWHRYAIMAEQVLCLKSKYFKNYSKNMLSLNFLIHLHE